VHAGETFIARGRCCVNARVYIQRGKNSVVQVNVYMSETDRERESDGVRKLRKKLSRG